ncbi:MAG TPA: MFS transporter [Cellulomonas sp.]
MSGTSTTTKGSTYAWLIVLACIGFYAIPVGVVGNTSGLFATPVMEEFGWSRTTATLYMTIQPWVAAICTPFAGRIMKRYNPRWVLTASALVYGLATIWTAYADQPWQWDLYGVIYGICASFFMFLAVPTLINAWFRLRAGLALGIAGATLSFTAAIFSKVGQALIDAHGWQYTRLVFGIIITVIPTVLAALFVRRDPASMGMEPYGAGMVDEPVVEAAPARGATLAQAKRSPAFYLLILVAGMFCLCAAFFQQIPSFTATGSLGADAGATAVSIIMVGGVVGKFFLGWLTDRVGSRISGIVAGVCGAVGLTLAIVSGSTAGVFYVGMAIFGVAYSALTLVPPMLAREGFGTANYSDIYSWVSTGIFIFSGAAALLYARIYDTTGSFTPAFVLVIVMYALTAVIVPIISRTARRSWDPSVSAPEAAVAAGR